MEAIRLYTGLGDTSFNHHPTYTGPYACISPVYGTKKKRPAHVRVPKGARVLQDSGAFSDACLTLSPTERRSLFTIKQGRLSFKEALIRQERHAEQWGYADQIEARASYDVLIDETWSESAEGHISRIKQRWSEPDAEEAVQVTVAAASYLNTHRNGLTCVMSAQGVTPTQYLSCVQRIIPHLRQGDILGLGGFCIVGRLRSLIPPFKVTISKVIPFLGREGIKRIHIWGVCDAEALGALLYLCDQYGLQLSTDSVGPTTRPIMKDRERTGCGVWGYASWRNPRYPVPPILESCRNTDQWGKPAPTCPPDTQCRGLERARHVEETRKWLAEFRTREPKHYKSPIPTNQYIQAPLFPLQEVC